MGNGNQKEKGTGAAVGRGFLFALPVLVVEFIIFFITPGTLKSNHIGAADEPYAYEADSGAAPQYSEAAPEETEAVPAYAAEETREEDTPVFYEAGATDENGDPIPGTVPAREVGAAGEEDFAWYFDMMERKIYDSEEYFSDSEELRGTSLLGGRWKLLIRYYYDREDPGYVIYGNADLAFEGHQATVTISYDRRVSTVTGEEEDISERADTVFTGEYEGDDFMKVILQSDEGRIKINSFFTANGGHRYGFGGIQWKDNPSELDQVVFAR